MNKTDFLRQNYEALIKASYLTDLTVQIVDNQRKVLALCWYTKIPLAGHVVSWICYYLYDSKCIQQTIVEIGKEHQKDLNEYANTFIAKGQGGTCDQIHQHSLTLGEFFTRFSTLAGQSPAANKSSPELKELPLDPLTRAGNLVQCLNSTFVEVEKIKRTLALNAKIPLSLLQGPLQSQLYKHYHTQVQALEQHISDLSNKEAPENEDLAIEQIYQLHEELQAIQDQLKIPSTNPARSLNLRSFFLMQRDINEQELKKISRFCKLISRLNPNQSALQSLYDQLHPIAEEHRKKLNQKVIRFATQSTWDEEVEEEKISKIKAYYQTVENFAAQTHQIGTLSKSPKRINRAILDLKNNFVETALKTAALTLKKISNDRSDLEQVARLDRLLQILSPPLGSDSKKIAHRIQHLAQKYNALKAAERLNQLTAAQLKDRVVELCCKHEKQTELDKFLTAKKTQKKIQSLQEPINSFSEFYPYLMSHLQACLQKVQNNSNFSTLSEETQQSIFQDLSNDDLFKFAKKYPEAEKSVEKALARCTPKAFSSLIDDLLRQIIACSDASQIHSQAVCDKLNQMKTEALTQAPPQNLTEALDYLKKQQEALIHTLSIADVSILNSIELHCTSSYIGNPKIWMKKKSMEDDCHCEVHHALGIAATLSRYYQFMKSHEKDLSPTDKDVMEIFNTLLARDLIKAANLLLRMPRRDEREAKAVKSALLKIRDQTTKTGEKPFARLPNYPQRQQFLTLASRLFQESPLAELAEELDLKSFQGKSWEEIRVQFANQSIALTEKPELANHPETLQLRDAAGWIIRSDYFQKEKPLLVLCCQKFYKQLVSGLPNLPPETFNRIFSYVPAGYDQTVSKTWVTYAEDSIAHQVPSRFFQLVDLLIKQLRDPLAIQALQALEKKTPPQTTAEARAYLKDQLQQTVHALSKAPRKELEKINVGPFTTYFILFGIHPSDQNTPCAVKKLVEKSSFWSFYHYEVLLMKKFKMNAFTKDAFRCLAEENSEKAIDIIIRAPNEKNLEKKQIGKFVSWLADLSQKNSSRYDEDLFSILPPSAKKDLFLDIAARTCVKIYGEEYATFSIEAILKMVDGIVNSAIQETTLVKIAALTLTTADLLQPLFTQICQRMEKYGASGKTRLFSALALEAIRLLEATRLIGYPERSAISFALEIPDLTIRVDVLKKCLSMKELWNASSLKEVLVALEHIPNKALFAEQIVDLIDKNLSKLEHPEALLPYIEDEKLKQVAKTLIEVKRRPSLSI